MAGEEDNQVVEQEIQEAPAAEVEAPKAEETAPETPKEEAVAAPAAPEEPEPEDWRAKELRRKHAQIKERDRELERVRKENEDLRAIAEARQQPPKEGEEPQPVMPQLRPQNLTQAQIQEAARQLRDQEKYQEQIITTNSAGEKAYGKEWGVALSNLATLTDEVDVATMRGIMATDAPEKVLYELGKKPSEYQRIMELAPERRQVEFVKLSLKQDAPKPKPSEAPAPTEPIAARVTPSMELSDKDDDDTWYKKRAAQRAARFKARMGA